MQNYKLGRALEISDSSAVSTTLVNYSLIYLSKIVIKLIFTKYLIQLLRYCPL